MWPGWAVTEAYCLIILGSPFLDDVTFQFREEYHSGCSVRWDGAGSCRGEGAGGGAKRTAQLT